MTPLVALFMITYVVALSPLPFSSNASSKVFDIVTLADMQRLAHADDELFVVLMYDDRDASSVRVVTLWEQLAANMEGFATVAGLNIANPSARFLVNAWNIQAVPMIRIVPPDLMTRPHTDPALSHFSGVKKITDYRGKLSVDGIRKAALATYTTNYIRKLKDETELENALADAPSVQKVILFTAKDATTDLYKALSIRFHNRLQFFEASASKPFAKSLMKKHEIAAAPGIILLPSGTKYPGVSFNMPELTAFLEPLALTVEQKKAILDAEAASTFATLKAKAEKGVVGVTTDAQFKSEVLNRGDITLLAFLDAVDEEHSTRVEVMKKFSLGISTVVKNVVWVPTSGNSALMEYFGVDSNAIVFVVPKKSRYTKFTGTFTDEGIRNFIENTFKRGMGSKEFKIGEVPAFVPAT
jgi:hypothetical protein